MSEIKWREYRGISGLVIARVIGEGDSEAYGPVRALAGARTVSAEAEQSSEAHYYDNRAAVVVDAEGAETVQLTVSVPDKETRALLEGRAWDGQKRALIGAPAAKPYYALGYKAGLTDGTEEYVWFLRGKFTGGGQQHGTEDQGTGAEGVTYTYTACFSSRFYQTERGRRPAKYIAVPSTHEAAAGFFERVATPANMADYYGVDFDLETGAATRLGLASGLGFQRFIGGDEGQSRSQFRKRGPWSGMEQRLRAQGTHALVARTGNFNFQTALEAGENDLFTYIPAYWHKWEESVDGDGHTHWAIKVARNRFDGAKRLPCFSDGKGVEIGGPSTTRAGGRTGCLPGLIPQTSTSLVSFESQAAAAGLFNSGWQDFLAWWMLLAVETASLNSQNSVASGLVSGAVYGSSDDYKIKEARTGDSKVVVKKANWRVGQTAYVGGNYYNGSIAIAPVVATEAHPTDPDNLMILELDCPAIETTVDDFCTQCAQPVPAAAFEAMGLECGFHRPAQDWPEGVCHSFVYGISDPWGNVWHGVSGAARCDGKLWLASGREASPAAFPAGGWADMGLFAHMDNGWPIAHTIVRGGTGDTELPFLVPTAMGGSPSKQFGDYFYFSADDGNRVPYMGGNWYNGSNAGAWNRYLRSRGNTYIGDGARPVYKGGQEGVRGMGGNPPPAMALRMAANNIGEEGEGLEGASDPGELGRFDGGGEVPAAWLTAPSDDR